jgi:hypothetical protein
MPDGADAFARRRHVHGAARRVAPHNWPIAMIPPGHPPQGETDA